MHYLLRGYPKYLGFRQVPQGIRGIYVCLDANENPLYVGQSKNIRKRFGNHSRLKDICNQGFKWLVVIPVPKDDLNFSSKSIFGDVSLDRDENKWISILNPLLNIMPVRGYGKR